ncbi:site-specific DNA-methyltransferase [Helicobacter pylori]|uniref:site-specific DNA-methyltransferase n=1 Tax=Helicobacter pylori TaxID=210 RepID=UPI002711EEC6|nr:site-specific DNA-methyltransferase [Helicobacter pylori]MDO7815238.1 site-specific DNA-methyltransferase [Helicobacter pylori]MDO7819768.1 site-specific DNA-methyltransferase [Helicobacter pylori]MDO7829163.1 site-specific DNA-methyltransferase [Helicobacter pylori]MDO7866175.1 site-specific DNA-methyltransferase [Helicobacter pylori]
MQNKEINQEKSVNEKNVEVFNRYFPGCLSMENDNQLTLDTRRLKALLGDFSEIKEEGYGLDFVGKKIALNQAFKKNHKILKPLNKSTSKHILIKGDNLDALKILKQSYSEKIKMIYIDPPYNTKNDNFIYGDDFSQSNEEVLKQLDYSKEKLDYIKNLFGLKSHSGWLSFMYPRLLLAKDLLKQDGVIFISIDDNECAQLKLLCDEIFGEGNFVSCFVWQKKSGGGQAKYFYEGHEYILIYCKNKDLLQGLFKIKEKGKIETDFLRKIHGKYTNNLKLKNVYEKYPNQLIEHRNLMFEEMDIFLQEKLITQEKYDEIKQNLTNGIYFLKPYNDKFNLVCRNNENNQALMYSIISGVWTSDGNTENEKLFGQLVFNDPKPINLLKQLIQSVTMQGNSDDIILDFFAGSGTTAHAVLESNKSDYQKLSEGGGLFNGLNAAFKERRFILVQLDEKIDPKKNKSAYDFCLNTLKSTSPSIFDITEERIKRAGAKIKEACPNLDVGFQAFEIIDDETHANDKNLSQAHQKDLFAYSNLDRMETQTILIKLLGCEGLELTTPIICLIENALYLALNTAFIVGDIEMSEVLENLKDKGVEKISMYMPAISNDRLCLELGSNLFDLKLESGDLKIRG